MNEFLQRADLVGLAAATLLASTPLVLAALGGVMSERSGVVNIALEGIMLTGAFMGYVAALASHNLWFGVGVAVLSGALIAALQAAEMGADADAVPEFVEDAPVITQVIKGEHEKVGRNDPCPCGSGKKYKKCHGATA